MRRAWWAVPVMVAGVLAAGCSTQIEGRPVAAAGGASAPAPGVPSGETITLDNPTITVAKRIDGVDFCSLLTPEDIAQSTGLTQEGAPSSSFLCTVDFAEGGFVFVSDIGAVQGAATEVAGNTAIVVQSDERSCQVTVALGPDAAAGNVLDIDATLLTDAPVAVCDGMLELARRAFDRLPPG